MEGRGEGEGEKRVGKVDRLKREEDEGRGKTMNPEHANTEEGSLSQATISRNLPSCYRST